MSTLTMTPISDTEIRATRSFDAPRELVWEAMTSPTYLPQWMLGPDGWTMPVCEADVRPGGAWRYVWRKDDGTEMEMRGSYLEVDPPERFVATESWGEPWPETVNTGVLTEAGGVTTLTLTIRYPSTEARDAAAATGMESGAAISYDRLDAVLARAST